MAHEGRQVSLSPLILSVPIVTPMLSQRTLIAHAIQLWSYDIHVFMHSWSKAVLRHRVCSAIGIVLLVLALPLAQVLPVTAQVATPEEGTPEVKPIEFSFNPKGKPDGSYFEIESKPGQRTDLTVSFANYYDKELVLRSYVADAYTVVNGGFGVADEGVNQSEPTTWIDYPADTYTFAPGEGTEVNFTVNVPDTAKPGQYIAALVLRTAEAMPIEGTSMFDQIIQKALAIVITVPGKAQPSFSIGEASYVTNQAGTTVSVDIANTGNVFVKPVGTVAIVNGAGEQMFEAPVAMGSIYTATSTQLQLLLATPLPEGEYTVRLDLKDANSEATAKTDALALAVAPEADIAETPIQMTDLAVAAGPDAKAPQFATITGMIMNTGDPIANARLTVHALKDGTEVESFPLIPSLSLAQGETPVQQRYIPGTGFTKGTWSFTLTLESIDPSSGGASLLLTQEIEQTIVVP